jgi:hypothetical protein
MSKMSPNGKRDKLKRVKTEGLGERKDTASAVP